MSISLKTKLTGFVLWLLAAQLLAVLAPLWGPVLGVSASPLDLTVKLLSASCLVAGVWLLVIQNKMMDIIQRIIGRLDNIAQGDLTDSIPLHRVDELGRLNDSLVTLQTHLKAMLAEIAEAADEVGINVNVLSVEMDQTRQVTHRQSDAASSIASAVEQLVASAPGASALLSTSQGARKKPPRRNSGAVILVGGNRGRESRLGIEAGNRGSGAVAPETWSMD